MDTIDYLDVPAEVSEHARVVIKLWLKHAQEAWLKSDLREAERLHQLIREKVSMEMAKSRRGFVTLSKNRLFSSVAQGG